MCYFGLKEDEINTIRYNNSYNPWDIYNADPTIKKVMDSLVDGTFADDYEKFRMIFNEVMYHNDEYFILADFHNYDQARFETEKLYSNKLRWAKMCLINIANSGYFSSDRTIEEYNRDIWHMSKIK